MQGGTGMKSYIAIDLKSFYASVECVERKLDPLTTNLVVADESRTEKTICLAVSPSLKAYGVSGRARLFEVVQKVKEVNYERKRLAPGNSFSGESADDTMLKKSPELAVSYIVAPPRMAKYIEYSTRIYGIYLKYIAPEDIHVYSIDEVFIDVTNYLETYKLSPRELAMKIIRNVLEETGVTATAGIGTNLYLCKIAMDIVAKHIQPDSNGVRVARLDEMTYRRLLWGHRPITDFWRVGRGYAKKLEAHGMYTMGDIARCSLGKPEEYYNEDLLYRLFGKNAELLIDHAWGYEPCTIADIKAYRPSEHSMGSGQVLKCPYPFEKARLATKEMADALALDLVAKGLMTDRLELTICYDTKSVEDPDVANLYKGAVVKDRYGRKTPKPAHGTVKLDSATSSGKLITNAAAGLFDEIVDKKLFVRRIYITAVRVADEKSFEDDKSFEQLDLFTDYDKVQKQNEKQEAELERERNMQKAILGIKQKYGKNALLKGMSFEDGATASERNSQIGGHKA